MIRYLGIERFAVIDSLEVEFRPGLNVLTGETGAGKSILVSAIALLTGARAYPELVRTGEDSALVQAIFEASDGSEITIRRDVLRQGRSRAFVDGVLASNAHLRRVTRRLVDLHGQHEHQRLLEPRYQIGLLDAFGRLGRQRQATAESYAAWREAREELRRLERDAASAADRREYLTFQVSEIEAAAPRAGEDAELEARRRTLASAERLQSLCADAYERLYEGDRAVLGELGLVWRSVDELVDIDPSLHALTAARAEVQSSLEDLAFTLRSYGSGLDVAPVALEETEARLATLERLKKKHGGDLASVLARHDSLRREFDALHDARERLDAATLNVAACRSRYVERSSELSRSRRDIAPELTGRLQDVLAELAMPAARCEFRFEASVDESRWQEDGLDVGELLLSANPGESVRPLAKVASGGELSRLTLGLKSMATTDEPGRTLVFDEVDAGIGGEVANVVGRRLRELGERFQVLCITHLPQIASAGDTQFQVVKSVEQGRTVTRVRRLDEGERAAEIARMIGGDRSTSEMTASARRMLQRDRNAAERPGESERAKAKGGGVV